MLLHLNESFEKQIDTSLAAEFRIWDLKSWEQTHQLESNSALSVTAVERIVVLTVSWFNQRLAIGKDFENEFLLVPHILEFLEWLLGAASCRS